MTRNGDDSERVAELELENKQLQQRLAQREHDAAEIADALEAAKGGEPWQTKTYLLIFWAVIGVRILLTSYCLWLLYGFVSLIAEVLVIGPSSVCLWKWAYGEVRKDLGNGLVKCVVMAVGLFVTAMIFSEGEVTHGYLNIVTAYGQVREPLVREPLWAFMWFSLLMLLMLSPFCEWMKHSLAQNPKEWFKPEGEQEEVAEVYDGLGEN